MLKKIVVVLCALLAVSAIVPSLAQADTCWNMAPFGSNLKLRFLPVGPPPNRYLITGVEDVFADRTVDGSASNGFNNPGTLRMGFSYHSNTVEGSTHLECNASVILGNGAGTWVCWRDVFGDSISGDLVLIPGCAGVPGVAPGPDPMAR
jgi:hypothetical protein